MRRLVVDSIQCCGLRLVARARSRAPTGHGHGVLRSSYENGSSRGQEEGGGGEPWELGGWGCRMWCGWTASAVGGGGLAADGGANPSAGGETEGKIVRERQRASSTLGSTA